MISGGCKYRLFCSNPMISNSYLLSVVVGLLCSDKVNFVMKGETRVEIAIRFPDIDGFVSTAATDAPKNWIDPHSIPDSESSRWVKNAQLVQNEGYSDHLKKI
ncbi:MAG: hypothetical protein GY749_30470 [Desulfobacteraceae bacterium]|nr:hypothetical protein [Desulfobacteraceae bacterium]